MHDRHDPCSSHGTLMIHSSQLYSPSLGPNSCSWLPDHRNGIWVHNGTNFRRSKHPSTTGWRSQGSSSHHFGSAQKRLQSSPSWRSQKLYSLTIREGHLANEFRKQSTPYFIMSPCSGHALRHQPCTRLNWLATRASIMSGMPTASCVH